MPDPLNGPTVLPTASPKATLGYGSEGRVELRVPSVTATLVDPSPPDARPLPIDLDDTVDAAAVAASDVAVKPMTATVRTAVLPRRYSGGAPASQTLRPRFDRVRALGGGAMGEVELVRDNDIRRTVAVKRLRGDLSSEAALLRFADEVRIVGQLEHPSIVPIYDVGQDEAGKVYLVMKHLQGETMEQLIDKLRAGDRTTLERFPLAHRVHLFLAILDAIRYAHARGIVHRDLKPANIMIGPYGEVTVLDWGIAKPMKAADPARAAMDSTGDARLLETRDGALAGTPLYMSPEQAAGKNDEVGPWSDVYSLSLVLYEWLALWHPLSKCTTVQEVLALTIARDHSWPEMRDKGFEAGVPMEYLMLCRKGLQRDRAQRFASVAELEKEIHLILSGQVRIQCHVTLMKRLTHALIHWVDRHTAAYSIIFLIVVLSMLASVVSGVLMVVRALR